MQQAFAAADTIRIEFDHFAQGPKYYNSGDWYVVLENEEDWEVYLNRKAPCPYISYMTALLSIPPWRIPNRQ